MKKNILNIIRNKQFQKRLLLFVVVLAVGFVLVLPKSLAVDNQAIKSVVIPSEKLNVEEKQAGAWKITESTEWTSKGEAKITFELDTVFRNNLEGTDFIFALDTSSSMNGDKLLYLKNSIKKFSEDLLNDPSNKISIVSFNNEANLLVDFTDNKDLVSEKVNSLVATGKTNYYNSLVKIGEVLNNYQVEENRNCVVVFVVGSYPTEGSPNQDTYFKYLKEEYSNIIFNAVQYELGDKVSEQIKDVSDNQYLASSKNLSDKLVKFLDVSEAYNEFSISEYINDKYFNVENENSISVNKGTVNLDKSSQKITWNVNNLKSGLGAKMEVKIKLKNEFLSQYDLYSVSKRIEVNSLIGEDREEVSNLVTPILSNNHQVIYDGNAPDGCIPSNIPTASNKSVFDVVTIADSKPTCKGYQFKGWKVVTDPVEKVNSEHFIMPDDDVIIRAEWSKIKVSTKMNGKIYREINLYDQVKLDYENGKANKYTGPTDTFNGNQDVYYYRGNTTNNNVLFGGFCWKMYRTTDTGGVKIIYNGEPDSAGKCGTDRGQHVGYGKSISLTLSSNYMYGTDYTYDKKSNKFTLVGTTRMAIWSDTSSVDLIGNYTCKNTTGTCSTLYYVSDYYSNEQAYSFMIDSTIPHSQIGKSQFNNNNNSIADAGYMYNKRYPTNYKSFYSTTPNYKYGNSFTYDEKTQEYTLSGTVHQFSDWYNNYKKLDNSRYTCWNTSGTCKVISYIFSVSSSSSTFYINMENKTSVEIALNEMLRATDVNKKNSTIKSMIDLWYSRNMTQYTDYLEDTVWCNSRRISELGGWNPNGGESSDVLNFWSYSNNGDLTCPDEIDSFTVNSQNGNGALTYPVGLVTRSESSLFSGLLSSGNSNWTLSPYSFGVMGDMYGYFVNTTESYDNSYVRLDFGVRPSVSLRAGLKYSTGDGSVNNPYVILEDR